MMDEGNETLASEAKDVRKAKSVGKALQFDFGAADPPKPLESNDSTGDGNPHAQRSTFVPEVVQLLQDRFGDAIQSVTTYANEHTVLVDKNVIVDVCRFLHDEMDFNYLADLGGADRFTEENRFEVFYNLVSFSRGRRIRLKVLVDEEELVVPTVTQVYRAANWNEREVFDMFGILFDGHEDLRRMYMPEDFEYFPLRKEFPLLGIPGSLPLPPQTPEGELTMDPFAAAHGSKPIKSYEEPVSDATEED